MSLEIKKLISDIKPISLYDLGNVEFDSRIDTKYIIHYNQLNQFLSKVKSELHILEIDENRIFTYENMYYDATDYIFYKKHHSGFLNRSKVRTRKYSDSGPYFFEIKSKNNKGKTVKDRVPLKDFNAYQNSETLKLLTNKLGYTFDELTKETYVGYQRITLTNSELTEKYTIDFGMETSNSTTSFLFNNLIVVEVKQIKYSGRSPFIRAMKEMKIGPTKFSKYCTSVVLLDQSVKHNRFKPILKNIDKIISA
jgi:hypothetical protein